YGSQKAQALFKDMMAKANEEFGFETDNVPLMIEAVPLSTDSIMIVVTKVDDPLQIEQRLETIGERPTHRTFKDNVETLDVISEYPNIHTAAKELNIKSTMIRRNVLHNANCASKGYSFIFAEEYKTIKRIDLYKLYHKKEYEGQHKPRPEQRRPIYCLTTNQKFDTADDAIKYFGLTKGTKIQSVCKGERQYAGKHPVNGEPLVYQYYDDYIKGIYRFYIPKNPKYRNERVDKIVSLYKERFAAKKF
ncbi:MAG: adaptor protein MecA, partial [Bacteroidales bacterium]|nr:adaptor protein MecA [Bacteroidales bacterium]